MAKVIIRAQATNWNNDIELLIRQGSCVARPIIMEKYDDGNYCPPTTSIKLDSAQVLMDDLWNAGVRPTEGSGSSGSLRATESHLSDMRKIVSKNLEVEL